MKNILKILIAMAIALCMLLTFVSCTDDGINKDSNGQKNDTEQGDDLEGTEDGDSNDQNGDDNGDNGDNGSNDDDENTNNVGDGGVAPGDGWSEVRPA